jgi:RHS repeat-associated protein
MLFSRNSKVRFSHISLRLYYTYDANKALLLAETSRNGISKRPEAKYIYYLHGPLKRVELAGNLQGIDYTYTLDGKLKAINHADLNPATDPGKDGLLGVSGFMQDQFGLILDYHHQDYAKQGTDFQTGQNMGTAERYDGLIKSSRWKIRNGSQSATLQQAYKYTYDKLGQLSLAEFGTYSPATQSLNLGNTNKESPSSYDIHGNILALQRTNASGANMDIFTYQYPTFSNRLSAVSNSGNSGYSAAMTYFANGNIKTLQEGSSPMRHLTYNAMGLTAKVAKGSTGNEPIVTFVYNERGQRIKKETYNPTGTAIAFTTYYVYDLGGNLLSTYEKYNNNTYPPQQKELYLYGADMLGVMHSQEGDLVVTLPAPDRIGMGSTTNTVYYLKDHLGNVRATLLREQPVHAGLLNWASYYPFGMRLVETSSISVGHATLISSYPQRHWYQGDYSELDPETGLQAFDLRMYSSRIGRWLSVDPYAQYWSPYLAMGNNPVSRIDPDGGFAICPKCPSGSQFDVYRNSPHYFYYDQGIVSNFDPVVISSTRLYDGGGGGWNNSFGNFLYDNNSAIGLAISTIEPGFSAGWDAIKANPTKYTNGAKFITKVASRGLVGLNVGLTYVTIRSEIQNGKFNTHSIVNAGVTVLGVGLVVTGAVITAPALGVIGAVVGVSYGIAQVAGVDDYIDSNWGFNNKP